jgi:hypothetical protein
VHLHHQKVGERAVVVGSELVSWSAVMTLRDAGCQVVLMTSEYGHTEAYAAFSIAGRVGLRVPVRNHVRVVGIVGRQRVEAVDLADVRTGLRRLIPCDVVVFTGDWIPDNELARAAGLDMDPRSLGPVVDRGLRTSRPGVFAAGNLLHPVDTADVAALDGRHVAGQVSRWLATPGSSPSGIEVTADEPFRWVFPGILRPDDPEPPRGRFLLWPERRSLTPTVTIRQGGGLVAQARLPWPMAPGRVFRVPSRLFRGVRSDGGPVTVGTR